MDAETVARLEALNAAFYDAVATEFSATRRAPWPGWARVVDRIGPVHSVLDVGCGNGRFLGALPEGVEYVGVDPCAALLADVPRRDGVSIVQGGWAERPWGARRFDLVVAFGLLHHVPSRARRAELIATLRSASTAFVAITAWRVDPSRAVPWSRVGVDRSAVEDGDYVLPFGRSSNALRYCHAIDDAEIDGWFDEVVDTFEADGRDGRSNRYVVARHQSASGGGA